MIIREKEKKISLERELFQGFLRELCQNFRVPIYETLPVDHFQCVSIMRKTNNEVTFYGRLKNN